MNVAARLESIASASISAMFLDTAAKALALDNNLAEAHTARGVALSAARNPADYKPPALMIHMVRSLGRESETKAAARKTVELAERELILHPEDPRPAIAGALALLELGEKDRARDWTTRAQAIDPEDAISLYNIACVNSHLGEFDAAFDLLDGVIRSSGRQFWKDWIENDSDLDGLRNHPRYPQLVALLNERFPASS